MASNSQEILQNKALEIEQHLTASDYSCRYTLIQNGINFTVFLVGRDAKFTIYYKPTKDIWSFYSVDEWANSEIQPRLKILPGLQTTRVFKKNSCIEQVERQGSISGPSLYFEPALECFHLLQPFAAEYIDFSIICEQTRIGIKSILDDPRYTHFDQRALQAALVTPSSFDFTNAKEYLTQCLTLCNIQIQL
jgi:hypothetical protein